MRDFAIAVDIAARPERVWQVMSDIERWPEWTPTVTRLDRLHPGPLAVGHRARILQPKLPAAIWQVTALDAGRSFTWVTRSPGVVVTGHHSVEPAGTGSRARLTLHFGGVLGTLVGRIFRGLNTRYLELEAAGLKRRSEAGGERG